MKTDNFARALIISSFLAVCISVCVQAAGVYDYAGGHHGIKQRQNNWDDSKSWKNGPAAYPDGPGVQVQTPEELKGDVDLMLNRPVTIGIFNWHGNQVYIYPGKPGGTLTVDNGGKLARWTITTYYGFRLMCDVILKNSVIISNWSNSSLQLGGVISGKGGLGVIWQQNRIRMGDECVFGVAPTDAPNTYAGGTYLIAVNPGKKGLFRARKNGAFGTGPVRLNEKATLILEDCGDRDDMIDDTAALYLQADAKDYATVELVPGVHETVAGLYINGKQQFAGTYGASGSGARYEIDDFFAGAGILTVRNGGTAPGIAGTTGARDISTDGAVLTGVIDVTNAAPTRAFMYWGTQNGGMNIKSWEHAIDLGIQGPGVIAAKISGCQPLEELYYRCCITNRLGVIWASPVQTVKLHGPPEVNNEYPVLRRDYVSLRGRVAATNGFPTKVQLYWGSVDGGTDIKRWQGSIDFGVVGPGMVSTNLTGLKKDTEFYYRIRAENTVGASWGQNTASFTSPGDASYNDITFFSVSDTHYEADPDENQARRKGIERLNTIPGLAYPGSQSGNRVDVPRGVLALGDLIDDGAVNELKMGQWAQWTNDFGVNGEGRVKFPVYEGFGNHDLNFDRFVQNQIKMRTGQRKDLAAVSENGYHYSWDWDQVHVVNLNLFPGNEHKSPNFGPVHNPEKALAFLKKDLVDNVGDSGRPVIIGFHYDPRDTWWTETQKSNFYDAVTNYNIICIIHGHTGTGIYKWRGLDVVNDGNFPSSIFVFHITSNQLYVIQRSSDDTWGISLTKPITFPPKQAGKKGR